MAAKVREAALELETIRLLTNEEGKWKKIEK
jgi:hypothetical protein